MKIRNKDSLNHKNLKFQEHKEEIIKKLGLAVSTAEIRIAFPELAKEYDDEELNDLIDTAVVEAVNAMIIKSETALRNTMSKHQYNKNEIPSGFCIIRHSDMLNMEGEKIFDRHEGVILIIVKVDAPYIYFNDGTFIAEDFKNNKDRYLFKQRDIADA